MQRKLINSMIKKSHICIYIYIVLEKLFQCSQKNSFCPCLQQDMEITKRTVHFSPVAMHLPKGATTMTETWHCLRSDTFFFLQFSFEAPYLHAKL